MWGSSSAFFACVQTSNLARVAIAPSGAVETDSFLPPDEWPAKKAPQSLWKCETLRYQNSEVIRSGAGRFPWPAGHEGPAAKGEVDGGKGATAIGRAHRACVPRDRVARAGSAGPQAANTRPGRTGA